MTVFRSQRENRINPGIVAGVVIAVVVMVVAVVYASTWSPRASAQAVVTHTPTAIIEDPETTTTTAEDVPATATSYVNIVREVTREVTRVVEVPVVVTATPVPPTPTPWVVREVVEVEVTRVVEVPVMVTATPEVLPPGTVLVCIEAAGVRGLYVDGVGVVGGSCTPLRSWGSASSEHSVRVDW